MSGKDTQQTKTDPRDLLYISDLDGTLLSTGSVFSKEATQRLNRLIDRGLKFTIATARNHDSAHPILKEVNLRLPVILFNGVYLTDFHSGTNLETAGFIPQEVMMGVADLVASKNIDSFVYSYGEEHRVYYKSAGNPGSMAYMESLENDTRLCQVREYDFTGPAKISGFLLIESREILEPIYNILKEKYPDDLNIYFAEDLCVPGYYWLQSYHREANKGSMVTTLSERLEIPLAQTVVFGDYLNDLCMFKVAGRAIAVANALPEVKQAAHQIIGNHHDYAVLEYLESLGFDNGSNGNHK